LYKLAVLISGSGSNLQAIIDAIEKEKIKNTMIALVISNREDAYGLERAKKHGIKNLVIKGNDPDRLLRALKTHEIDSIVLAGYLSILPPDIIEAYNKKIVNIHPSLLPKHGGKGFYGIKVHQAVLASGDEYSGATAHLVDCGIDTGAVLVRGVIPVLPDDTAESLQKRVLKVEYKVLVHAVKAMAEGRSEELARQPETFTERYD